MHPLRPCGSPGPPQQASVQSRRSLQCLLYSPLLLRRLQLGEVDGTLRPVLINVCQYSTNAACCALYVQTVQTRVAEELVALRNSTATKLVCLRVPHCSPSCRTWTYVSSRRAVKCSPFALVEAATWRLPDCCSLCSCLVLKKERASHFDGAALLCRHETTMPC